MDFFISYSSCDASIVAAIRHNITELRRLRSDIVHETAHRQFYLAGYNSSGMSSVFEALRWFSGLARVDEQFEGASTAVPLAAAPLVQVRSTEHGFVPQIDRAALLHLLDGILTALGLTLILVLAALARRPDGLTFVLVMLAACLRYGRREEPGDPRLAAQVQYRTSLGSSPPD